MPMATPRPRLRRRGRGARAGCRPGPRDGRGTGRRRPAAAARRRSRPARTPACGRARPAPPRRSAVGWRGNVAAPRGGGGRRRRRPTRGTPRTAAGTARHPPRGHPRCGRTSGIAGPSPPASSHDVVDEQPPRRLVVLRWAPGLGSLPHDGRWPSARRRPSAPASGRSDELEVDLRRADVVQVGTERRAARVGAVAHRAVALVHAPNRARHSGWCRHCTPRGRAAGTRPRRGLPHPRPDSTCLPWPERALAPPRRGSMRSIPARCVRKPETVSLPPCRCAPRHLKGGRRAPTSRRGRMPGADFRATGAGRRRTPPRRVRAAPRGPIALEPAHRRGDVALVQERHAHPEATEQERPLGLGQRHVVVRETVQVFVVRQLFGDRGEGRHRPRIVGRHRAADRWHEQRGIDPLIVGRSLPAASAVHRDASGLGQDRFRERRPPGRDAGGVRRTRWRSPEALRRARAGSGSIGGRRAPRSRRRAPANAARWPRWLLRRPASHRRRGGRAAPRRRAGEAPRRRRRAGTGR